MFADYWGEFDFEMEAQSRCEPVAKQPQRAQAAPRRGCSLSEQNGAHCLGYLEEANNLSGRIRKGGLTPAPELPGNE